MKKVKMLDDTDRLLLKTLSKYPGMNQVRIAKEIGLTQPAISLRLRKLKRMGLINDLGMLLDATALGLKMTKVDLRVKNQDALTKKFRRCPVVANSYTLEEDNGMCMILAGESEQFLNCMVAHHLRKNPDVINISSKHMVSSAHGFRTNMNFEQKLDAPPCGDDPCDTCEYYIDNGGECPGCPVTKFYKGTFWK
ncbi:MAG: Lrp/AsnC family transcriptional regulator [Nitrososphaerales archaeon]